MLGRVVGETLDDIKRFVRSYIETYQESVNTQNAEFMHEIVRRSNRLKRKHFQHKYGPNVKVPVEFQRDETEDDPRELFRLVSGALHDLDDASDDGGGGKQVKWHRVLAECYFAFVRGVVQDYVPKRIKHRMVHTVLAAFESRMHAEVFVPYVVDRAFDRVLVEEDGAKEDRLKAEEMLKAVDKALDIMVEIQVIWRRREVVCVYGHTVAGHCEPGV